MFIRLEPQGGMFQGKQHYDGICEALDDFELELRTGYVVFDQSNVELAPGSLALCMEDMTVYIKSADNGWYPLTEG